MYSTLDKDIEATFAIARYLRILDGDGSMGTIN